MRCTARLQKRLKLENLPEPPAATAVLGDWYANLLTLQRQPLVLCVSERSLLAVVLPARDLAQIGRHFLAAVRERLLELRVPDAAVEAELARLQPLYFGATRSRSVLGSMNDFFYQLNARASYEPRWQWTVGDLARDLGKIPCAPLGYRYPSEAARELLGGGGKLLAGRWGGSP